MGTYYCTHGAHAHCTLPAVDAVHLMVLLALPERNILHGRNQGVILKHRGVQVRTQVLCTHGGPAHQTGLHSRLIYCFRAIMAGHRLGVFAFRPCKDANTAWRSWTRLLGENQRWLADMVCRGLILSWSWDPRKCTRAGGWSRFLWRCMNSCLLCVFLGGCKKRCITYIYFIRAIRVIQCDDFFWFTLALPGWDFWWHITCRYCITVRDATGGWAITTFRLWSFVLVHFCFSCLHADRLHRFL